MGFQLRRSLLQMASGELCAQWDIIGTGAPSTLTIAVLCPVGC